jgi:hypothetical protein
VLGNEDGQARLDEWGARVGSRAGGHLHLLQFQLRWNVEYSTVYRIARRDVYDTNGYPHIHYDSGEPARALKSDRQLDTRPPSRK